MNISTAFFYLAAVRPVLGMLQYEPNFRPLLNVGKLTQEAFQMMTEFQKRLTALERDNAEMFLPVGDRRVEKVKVGQNYELLFEDMLTKVTALDARVNALDKKDQMSKLENRVKALEATAGKKIAPGVNGAVLQKPNEVRSGLEGGMVVKLSALEAQIAALSEQVDTNLTWNTEVDQKRQRVDVLEQMPMAVDPNQETPLFYWSRTLKRIQQADSHSDLKKVLTSLECERSHQRGRPGSAPQNEPRRASNTSLLARSETRSAAQEDSRDGDFGLVPLSQYPTDADIATAISSSDFDKMIG